MRRYRTRADADFSYEVFSYEDFSYETASPTLELDMAEPLGELTANVTGWLDAQKGR